MMIGVTIGSFLGQWKHMKGVDATCTSLRQHACWREQDLKDKHRSLEQSETLFRTVISDYSASTYVSLSTGVFKNIYLFGQY